MNPLEHIKRVELEEIELLSPSDLKYWIGYSKEPDKVESLEQVDIKINNAIVSWNNDAELPASLVREEELQGIFDFGRSYWKSNNQVLDKEVIKAYIFQS
jgi:hypothetical protein